jgi:hypothetical protein
MLRINRALVAALVVCIVSMILVARAPQKAVKHVVIVEVVSRDRARVVDYNREGAVGGDCACSRRIEFSNGAIAVTHEAVVHTAQSVLVPAIAPAALMRMGWVAAPWKADCAAAPGASNVLMARR